MDDKEIEDLMKQLRHHLTTAKSLSSDLARAGIGLHYYNDATNLSYIATIPGHVRGVKTTTQSF